MNWCLNLSACAGTCGADFLPLTSTSAGSVRKQVILSTQVLAGCGRLTMCHFLLACSSQGNIECSVELQLWQTNASGGFSLKSNSSFREVPSAGAVYTLSIPLDMEFTTGDVVGLGFSSDPPINAFDVHIASAPNHSYLQWMTSGTTLTVQDATTVTGRLPILSVEGMQSYTICCTSHVSLLDLRRICNTHSVNAVHHVSLSFPLGTCHPCPSSAQTLSISDQKSTSLQDAATSDGTPTLCL